MPLELCDGTVAGYVLLCAARRAVFIECAVHPSRWAVPWQLPALRTLAQHASAGVIIRIKGLDSGNVLSIILKPFEACCIHLPRGLSVMEA
jgi:hypothetical protein